MRQGFVATTLLLVALGACLVACGGGGEAPPSSDPDPLPELPAPVVTGFSPEVLPSEIETPFAASNAATWADVTLVCESGAQAHLGPAGVVSLTKRTAVDGAAHDVQVYGADDGGSDSGSAYVFTHVGSSWTQTLKLELDGGTAGALLGSSVSVSGDVVLVGAPGASAGGVPSGAAFLY